ncbi:ATP-binding protein [Paenibacillus sp. ACRRX]|uniref:sensor histidine kinase n=1 Tax=unclassified Paenibacillus TaxID=185978 RepID=UPI001EF6385D|nr:MULTISPECIES: ATP-binding protein [unclassified Paenibacillus]MCG7409638.1 ATP-binding protein [Paenibacillus sp. ACRRX]MDK8183285.1 ATP-binding protein [Paenibacillus sp. UMB4589-SE434]
MSTNKLLHTVRWRFLLVLIASAAVTGLFILLGNLLATYLLPIKPYNIPLILTINNIGSKPTAIVLGIIIFIFSYYQFSRSVIGYLEEIRTAAQHIAKGQYDTTLPIKGSDELGGIAFEINQVASELNSYLQEITYGLGEIAKGQFQHTIPVKPEHELGRVAESINEMSAQLSQSIQEERNAEKTKNDLITGVSHDLRTPLTSILGFLELIDKDRYQDEIELRYYVNIAYEKANSLKKLIDDLFEYTRINNGLPLELKELHIVSFIRQLAEEFVPSLENAGMTCRIHTEHETLKVLADGDRLVRAYENLVSNAIQYGRKGQYVDIEIGVSREGAVVSITNYGDPISERDLPFIFDRFYRVEQSRSKATGGTGLGLAITKSIIEVHGGRISVMSDRRQTTFETRLPLVSESSKPLLIN